MIDKTTPEFCKGCAHLQENGCCVMYKKCAKWRQWFRIEWAIIQRVAQKIKEQEENENEAKGDTGN